MTDELMKAARECAEHLADICEGDVVTDLQAEAILRVKQIIFPSYLSGTPAQTKGDDLVERLSNWADVLDIPSGDFVNQDLRQAASRIQSLTASNEALGAQIERMEYSDGDAEHWRHLAAMAQTTRDAARENFHTMQGASAELLAKLQAAQAEIARMREALEGVADESEPADVEGLRAFARTALTPQEPK